MLLAAPVGAQKMTLSSGPHNDDPSGTFSTAPLIPAFEPLPGPQIDEDESCLPWTALAVRGFTVSVMRLQIPAKARSEFGKACGDLKKRRLTDAEQHARNAIEVYPNYVAAWVMLGQVLEGLQRTEEARKACEHALSTDLTGLI
jgi:tetratricopeptide (TPR) repeat protein